MKIQYFSDIHLEFGDFQVPATDADVIIAAGDIGVGTQGIRWLKKLEKPVVYVAGNHEYYGGDLLHTYERIASMAQGTSVHFLENEAVELGGVRFLGTTLWTDFDGGDRETMSSMRHNMNDYGQIQNQQQRLDPEDLFEVNWQARDWLRRTLADPFDGRTVVVTHHAPSNLSWNGDYESGYRPAYCNGMDGFIEANDIDLWFHGHVHRVFDYDCFGARVICNPRGYNGHQNIDGFDAGKIIDL